LSDAILLSKLLFTYAYSDQQYITIFMDVVPFSELSVLLTNDANFIPLAFRLKMGQEFIFNNLI